MSARSGRGRARGVRDQLAERGLAPSKARGQCFLHNPDTAERIVRAGDLQERDAVIEIGPGLGALTRQLCARSRRCLAIEIDRGIVEVLRSDPAFERLELLHADVLDVDLAARARELGRPVLLIGNLPYSISGRLLGQILLAPNPFRRWIFMLQTEVAERLCAEPGSPAYGPLAVYAALRTRVSRVMELGPDEFVPRPRVRSTLLRFDPLRPRPRIDHPEALRWLVRRVFQQRRKTLQRVLREWMEQPGPALELLGVDPRRRGETLDPLHFVALSEALLQVPEFRFQLTLARAEK